MDSNHRSERVDLLDVRSKPMRAFHLSWVAFFLCFFAWFAIAPLMPLVREELGLSDAQVGNTIIASIAITVLARLIIGGVCDRFGPRRTYAWLLGLGALPVMGIGLSWSYESFLAFRLAIGAIGASFVITQVHTAGWFTPRVVGTATATTAGWGNLGGGVTQVVMPMVVLALTSLGLGEAYGWRVAMIVPGLLMLVMAPVYWRWAEDPPVRASKNTTAGMWRAARDYRVWILFALYGACFGVELTMHNVAALYFHDRFHLGIAAAGLVAALFGGTNLFARTLGGWLSDRVARVHGLRGRVLLLGTLIAAEGLALLGLVFSGVLPLAIGVLIIFSLLVQASEGATFALAPLVDRDAVGAVSGIVGAGGNVGAVLAGVLIRVTTLETALMWLGVGVLATAGLAFALRFREAEERSVVPVLEGA